MRRDMDLIRDILKTVADSNDPIDAHALADDTHPFPVIAYHAQLLQEAGLANVSLSKTMGGDIVNATIGPLTWEGNDFLDAVRSEKIWNRTKRLIASKVGSVSFEVIKALAVKLATEALLG